MKGLRRACFGAVSLIVVGTTPLRCEELQGPHLQSLTIIAPASVGGGWDQTARAMQRVLMQTGLAGAVEVHNSPGAGGAIGLAQFVNAEKGHGAALLVGGLVMVSALRTNGAAISLAETTPIARLTGEYDVIAVPAASELRDLNDLVLALRVNPGAVSWGGGSAGGVDQLLITQMARAIGAEPVRMVYVPFSGGGEVAQALISQEISVGVSGYAELAPYVAAGQARVLAISAEKRLPGIPIPTLRDYGIDLTLVNWRGLFAPPGINEKQRVTLIAMVESMVRTPAWRQVLRTNRWMDLYLPDRDFADFVQEEVARVALGPDPRGTTAAQKPGVVWTSGMLIQRHRNLLASLVLSAGLLAVGFIAWQRGSAVRREGRLFQSLKAARQEAADRGVEAESLLQGLGKQIDMQFRTWGLTAAECEVALLMLKGLRHKQIASVRETTERTVRQQALTIYKKAGLDGRTDLAAFFLEDLLQPAEAGARRQLGSASLPQR